MDYTLSARDQALMDLLWEYMKRDSEYKDRVRTSYGTKTQFGLARCIDSIYAEHSEDGTVKGQK